MNRAEHIREAQRLADLASSVVDSPGGSVLGSEFGIDYANAAAQAAQAHAAIAAALPLDFDLADENRRLIAAFNRVQAWADSLEHDVEGRPSNYGRAIAQAARDAIGDLT